MKKKQPWYSFRLIVPALIVLPPLGLILLWKSPRTPRVKLVTSVLYAVFLTAAFVGVVKGGVYERYIESKHPAEGVYDVRMDSRNSYVSQEILPFERKIFSAVVRADRQIHADTSTDIGEDIIDYQTIDPKAKAYQVVANQYGLEYETVRLIYRKASIIISKHVKK